MGSKRRLLHIDLDAFFVSVEQALSPALRGRPVAVGGDPRGRGVVASASYEARKYGLRSGMPLATARRLCPQAIFLEGRFHHYRAASERFFRILADFTPFVEPVGIDEAFLDITGFESLHGSPGRMALGMKQRIKNELRLPASVGIAATKVVAKIASDMAKPDGLVEVAAGEEGDFLAPLPLSRLPGVGPRTERVLRGLGIATIGQLAALPPALPRRLLGAMGWLIHDHARGIDPSRVEPPAAAKSISRSTTFAQDTLDRGFVEATLRYLSEKVGAQLRGQGRQARGVVLKLRYSDFETVHRQRRLARASDSDQVIFEAGLALLERLLSQRLKLVRLVGIGVFDLGEGRQLSLLPSPGERLVPLNRALDRLRRKYGFTSIQTGRTLLLGRVFATERGDYVLTTPALSR
ncbi:MAG: DNA polymerase IV [Dehalococcoidia bacterium]